MINNTLFAIMPLCFYGMLSTPLSGIFSFGGSRSGLGIGKKHTIFWLVIE
jgi:hypothetical protein